MSIPFIQLFGTVQRSDQSGSLSPTGPLSTVTVHCPAVCRMSSHVCLAAVASNSLPSRGGGLDFRAARCTAGCGSPRAAASLSLSLALALVLSRRQTTGFDFVPLAAVTRPTVSAKTRNR